MRRTAKELGDKQIIEPPTAKSEHVQSKRAEARTPGARLDSALAGLERARTMALKEQVAVRAAQAGSSRAKLREAQDAVKDAEARASGGRRDE